MELVGVTWISKASQGIGVADLLLMIVTTKWNEHDMIIACFTVPAVDDPLCGLDRREGGCIAAARMSSASEGLLTTVGFFHEMARVRRDDGINKHRSCPTSDVGWQLIPCTTGETRAPVGLFFV